ncbi:MAG: glutathione S-transferase N-terminal domain-containing protein [Hyphomicrobiales bacterium]|nr:glutathione S-transferase N-terminal domain-containing protein [Hyphomicrobiales bacterium]
MLKVYGRANSINVRKVLWLLDELELPYEREDWGRGFQPVSDPAFTAINPLAVIPAIDDDGFILSESNVILRYLAAKHERTDLLPTEIKQRAIVERWMDWQVAEQSTASRAAFIGGFIKAPIPGGEDVIRASLEQWPQTMLMIEQQLQGSGGHIAGPKFTLADIPIGLSVQRWFAIELPELKRPDLPATRAYYERLSARSPYMTHGRNGMP